VDINNPESVEKFEKANELKDKLDQLQTQLQT
jgi:hypothetical protein